MNSPKNKRKTPKDFFKSLEEATGFVYHLTASNTELILILSNTGTHSDLF